MIFFLIPLFGVCWLVFLPALEVDPRRSQAQRATAKRPRTQIRAQRRAARITTKSDSTATASGGSATIGSKDEDELAIEDRNL